MFNIFLKPCEKQAGDSMVDGLPNQLDEYDYFSNKRSDRTYVSKSFQSTDLRDLDPPRNIRILSKVFDTEADCEFVTLKKELVLYKTTSGRQEVKICFYEDSREIKHITIQRFSTENGKPHKHGFTISGTQIETLFNILRLVKYIEFEDSSKERLDDNVINDWLLSEFEKRKYFLENLDLVKEISEHHLTKSDVVAIGYRKHQLEIFYSLLNDDNYFSSVKDEWQVKGNEGVWQRFFEANPWIFGYGLNYVFSSQLDSKKLEQVTTGFSFCDSGKRVDALMKTKGLISSLCFVELKTHKTPLLKNAPYRSECWPASDELCGSVSQIQKTIQKAVKSIQTRIELVSEDGNPTGETTFLYQPKSIVVIGNLGQFVVNDSVNEQKFSSFELFRRNVYTPEIITFDELYERAKCIVDFYNEELTTCNDSAPSIAYEDGEIPF